MRYKNTKLKWLCVLPLLLGFLSAPLIAQEEALDAAAVDAIDDVVAEVKNDDMDDVAPQTPAEKEAAAAEKQAKEQEVARWAIPMVSGFALGGLDPEALDDTGILVMNQGKVGLAQGSLTVNEGNYDFTGANLVPKDATWFDVPFNKALFLGAIKWIALSAVLGWPFVGFVLRGTMYANEAYDPTSGSYFYRFIGWIMNLMVLVIMAALFLLAIRRPELWPQGPAVQLSYILPMTIGLAVTAGISLLGSVVSWAKGYWRIPSRLHFLLTIVSALGFLWYLSQTGILRHLLEMNG